MTKRRAWNSTLPTPTKPIKVRPFRNRRPGRYGPLWEAVGRMPCFLRDLAPELHPRCGLGYASGHTAHHVIPAGLDEEGLVPCCGQVHDVLERFKRRQGVDFLEITGVRFEVDVYELGLIYVARAQARLSEPDLGF